MALEHRKHEMKKPRLLVLVLQRKRDWNVFSREYPKEYMEET